MDTAVGHEHEEDVVQDEVGAQTPRFLGPAGQFVDRSERVFTARLEINRIGKGRNESCGKSSIACVQFTHFLDHETETVPWIQIGKALVDNCATRVHLLRECLGDQHLLGRKSAVQGGRCNSGAPGNLPHGHIQTVNGEDRSGGLDDALAVVKGVGAKGVRQTIGHGSHFSEADSGVR